MARPPLRLLGPDEPHEDPTAPDPADWLSLVHIRGGRPSPTVGNAALWLANLPEWAGTLGFDTFAGRIVWLREPPPMAGMPVPQPGPLLDHHYAYLRHWFSRHRSTTFAADAMADGVALAARQAPFHPILDPIRQVPWDGTPRLDTWLWQYLSAPPTPYTRAVGRWWLLSAVARLLHPGCQADHLLVLEGPQGEGKSSAVRLLGGSHYLGFRSDLWSKDAVGDLAGRWIVEIAELDALSRVSLTRVKDFLTQTNDVYRPPYGRHPIDQPRQCVFVGTTNDSHYLQDATGARRFWPVVTATIHLERLAADRSQLWAEALHAVLSGENWWPPREASAMLAEEQEARYSPDEWETRIAAIAATLPDDGFSVGDVLERLNLAVDRWSRPDQMRAGKALRRLGYLNHKVRRGETTPWLWFKPEVPAE